MLNPPVTGNDELDAWLYNLSIESSGFINKPAINLDADTTVALSYTHQYIHIKYADDNIGTGLSNVPLSKAYWGIFSSPLEPESTNTADYTWNKAPNGFGLTNYLFYLPTGNRSIRFAIATSPPSSKWLLDSGSSVDIDILVPAGTVVASDVANLSVTTAKIAGLAITTVKLDDFAVTSGKLATNSVTADKILNDSVTTNKILNDSVTTNKILNDSVTTNKILNDSVTSDKILNDSVTTNKILNDSVTSDKILSLAVTTSKISDGAVTQAQIKTKESVTLLDASAILTASQLIDYSIFTITPTVSRVLTTDTAVNIISLVPRYQVGTWFDFLIVNNDAFDVTISAGTGITLVGNIVINNSSGTWKARIDSSTSITIYRC